MRPIKSPVVAVLCGLIAVFAVACGCVYTNCNAARLGLAAECEENGGKAVHSSFQCVMNKKGDCVAIAAMDCVPAMGGADGGIVEVETSYSMADDSAPIINTFHVDWNVDIDAPPASVRDQATEVYEQVLALPGAVLNTSFDDEYIECDWSEATAIATGGTLYVEVEHDEGEHLTWPNTITCSAYGTELVIDVNDI